MNPQQGPQPDVWDVELARFRAEFGRRLAGALDGRSLRGTAKEAGITHPTLHRLLRGQVMPDVGTILRLERVLGVDLWPSSGGIGEHGQDLGTRP